MKIFNDQVKDQNNKKEFEQIIESELAKGKLYVYRRKYHNAHIVLSPGQDQNVDCWGNIFAENKELIGRFSIVNGKLIMSNLIIKGL